MNLIIQLLTKRRKANGRSKLAMVNRSLVKEIEFGKGYLRQRENEFEEARRDVIHKFQAGKESLLKDHSAMRAALEAQQEQFKALKRSIEVSFLVEQR